MIFIIASLILGIILGFLFRKKQRVIKISEKIASVTVFFLLFFLGFSVGSKKDIINKIHEIGLQALIISFFAIIFSVGLSYIVYKFILKEKKDD